MSIFESVFFVLQLEMEMNLIARKKWLRWISILLTFIFPFQAMAAQPPVAKELTDSPATQEQFKSSLMLWQDFESELFGIDGAILKARQSLGLNGNALTYNNTGHWVTDNAYVPNDLVVSGGIAYKCVVAHTSGTFEIDSSTGKWLVHPGFSREELARTYTTPEYYGAKGNGVADDTSAFNTMLSNLKNGTTINLQRGKTYLVGNLQSVTGLHGLTVNGNGSTLKLLPGTTAGSCLTFITCENLKITGIIFDRQNSYNSAKLSGVFLSDCIDVVVSENDFSECSQGVYVGGKGNLSERITLLRNKMIGRLPYSASNDTGELLPDHLFNVQSGKGHHLFINNYCYRVKHAVQYVVGEQSKVIGNILLDGHNSQIYVCDHQSQIIGNIVVNAGKDGIKLNGTNGHRKWKVNNAIISDNIVLGAGVTQPDGGISINVRGENNHCTGNVVGMLAAAAMVAPAAYGIFVVGSKNNIKGNVIKGSSPIVRFGNGIFLQGDMSIPTDTISNKIEGNSILNVGSGVVLLGRAGVLLANNSVISNHFKNLTNGVLSQNLAASSLIDGTIITNNIFDTMSANGILITNQSNVCIRGNKFKSLMTSAVQAGNVTGLIMIDNATDGTGSNSFGNPPIFSRCQK